nr:hypothetical protein [Novosphingopyxis sp. YJ-S2-01]
MMVAIVLITTAAWIGTTWIKVKNGYPLTGSWGQSIYPKNNEETVERVKLISQENAQLRAELSSVKERLATVERIVTDGSNRLSDEIESLRGRAN